MILATAFTPYADEFRTDTLCSDLVSAFAMKSYALRALPKDSSVTALVFTPDTDKIPAKANSPSLIGAAASQSATSHARSGYAVLCVRIAKSMRHIFLHLSISNFGSFDSGTSSLGSAWPLKVGDNSI